MKTKLLIADDHKIVRDGLRSLLEKQPDMEVVGEAQTGRETIRMARQKKPDVLIMDISMPDTNGIEAAKKILAALPGIKIIALSMHSERILVREMIQAGAHAFLLKECAFDELIAAVKSVLNNQTAMSKKIADIVIHDYVRQAHAAAPAPKPGLSDREMEVLQMVAEGLPTKAMAHRMGLSIKTVETHRQQIMKKLDLHSVAALTKYAIREGLTELNT